MLDGVFMRVLDMTKTASVVILIVLLARLLLKRAPKWISYALWAVVLLRLLCPVSLESPVSLVPQMEPVAESYTLTDASVSPAGAAQAAVRAVGDVVNGGLGVQRIKTAEPGESVASLWWEVWVLAGQYIWLGGIAVMLIYSAVSYIRLRRRLIGALPLGDDIFLADHVASPFVMGLVRPKIYLPSSLGEREQEYIILHERHHIRRLDHVMKALAFLALCIHWFNPLVWLAFVLAGKDMEMSCDEAVIKALGGDICAEYSASLLGLATGRRVIAGTPLAFGEGDTGGRIKNLAKWKKPVIWIVIIAVLFCAVLAVCLLTDPLGKKDTLKLMDMDTTGDFAVSYEADIGGEVKSGSLIAEMWRSGECIQSAPVPMTRFVEEIDIRMTPRREDGAYTGVDVQIDTDQYGGTLMTYFALPEYGGGIGWSMKAYEKGEKIELQPGEARVLAAMSFDFGNGVRSFDCETLEKEPERLKEAECMIVILAHFSAEELAPQAEDEAVSYSKEVLQLHHVIKLAEKGYELSWADFEDCDYQETGSGLYIRHYPIDDTFSLWIGGSHPQGEVMYIYLSAGDLDTRIDIRDGGVEEFIAEHSQSPGGEKTMGDGALERMANIRAEDIKYISSAFEIDPEALANAMNNAVAHRIERSEGLRSFWNVDVYPGDGKGPEDENFRMYIGFEENIVQLFYHDSKSTYSTYYFDDPELYWLLRNSHHSEGLIDTEAVMRYGDIISTRAEGAIREHNRVSEGRLTGYELTEFFICDLFLEGNEQYEVYEWDVAFTVDDPWTVAWAGGMWLDSELRVRAYDEYSYFVVRLVDGEARDYSFLFWDLYMGETEEEAREHAWNMIGLAFDSEEEDGAETDEERMTAMESFINAMPNNGLTQSFYDNIWEAELYQLIYQCADETVDYERVAEAYAAEVGPVETDLSYISSENLDRLLLSLTGYGLAEREWDLGGAKYLSGADVYCIMHGDTNYDPLLCSSYTAEGDIYTLRCHRSFAETELDSRLITLRDIGGGAYQFVSCQPLG